MGDNITLVETNHIDDKIHKILRQTDYTEEEAREKLKEFGFNEISVIKTYFGINDTKPKPLNSINQEIYRQLRYKLDSNMRDYNQRVEKGEAKQLL